MARSIGTLAAFFRADTSNFDTRIDGARRNLRSNTSRMNRAILRFERNAKRSLGRAAKSFLSLRNAVATLAGSAGLGLLVKNSLDTADSIDKASKAAGISAERMQTLRFATEQMAGEARLADEGMRRFNRRLGEFINSGGGPAQKAFEQLGLAADIAGGRLRGTEAVFDETARRIAAIEDPARRAALASQVFGDDAGPKLALLLSEGFDALRRTEDGLRNVIPQEAIDKGVRLKDELGKLSTELRNRFATAVLNNSDRLQDFVERVGEAIPALVRLGRALLAGAKFFADYAKSVHDAVEAVEAFIANRSGDTGRFRKVNREISRLAGEIRDAEIVLSQLRDEGKQGTEQYRRWADNLKTFRAELSKLRREQDRLAGQLPERFGLGGGAQIPSFQQFRRDLGLDQAEKAAAAVSGQAKGLNAAVAQFAAGASLGPSSAAIRGIERAGGAIDALVTRSAERFSALEEAGRTAFQGITDALTAFVRTGEFRIGEFVRSLSASLLGSALNRVFDRLGAALFGGRGGGLSIPGFAHGGRPPVGRPVLVGERGPEIFVPDMAGRIVPNDELGGGGQPVVQMTVVTPNAQSFQENQASIGRAMGMAARRARFA